MVASAKGTSAGKAIGQYPSLSVGQGSDLRWQLYRLKGLPQVTSILAIIQVNRSRTDGLLGGELYFTGHLGPPGIRAYTRGCIVIGLDSRTAYLYHELRAEVLNCNFWHSRPHAACDTRCSIRPASYRHTESQARTDFLPWSWCMRRQCSSRDS